MNISSNETNLSESLDITIGFHVFFVECVISLLLNCPLNTYVIWLIMTGTGNGLASEFFNLNLSVCEILLCVQTLLLCVTYTSQTTLIVALFLDGVFITGHPMFQCLMCVERYLAVVHPVMFLKFKPLRYRLMCSAVTWMLSFATGGLSTAALLFASDLYFILWLTSFIVFLCIKFFCCVAVLRVLKQSGPGERGREREEENKMKRRVFYLILITIVNTVLLYAIFIILVFLSTSVIIICIALFLFIFTGLVQPVFFLFRVGKLNFMKCQ